MVVLLLKLYAVFKKAPLGIVAVFAMDVAEVFLLSMNPFIIGLCIDGLFEHNYIWFYILIVLQFLLIAVHASNKFLDTRVYEKIIEAECRDYYEEKIQTNTHDSQISSRLNLVDEIISFFDVYLIQIINILGGIVFSLAYIFKISKLLFLSAILISTLVYILTTKYHKRIIRNNIKLQEHDEIREEVISSRSKQQFKIFTRTILNLRIDISDLEVKAYLITDILQSGFLIIAIVLTVNMGNYTSGQMFTTITYIMLLNECVCEINEVRVKIYDLMDSVTRLGRNE